MKFTLFTLASVGLLQISAMPLMSNTFSASAALGTQFVTGKCQSDADCQEGCCAFHTSKCAGPGIAQTNTTDGGCGHGEARPNCQVALALGLVDTCVQGAGPGILSPSQLLAAVKFVSKLDHINVPADASASLASAVAMATSGSASNATSDAASLPINAHSTTSASASISSSVSSTMPPVSTSAPTGLGTLFVTEACTSDADCQQGCCAFSTGKCAGPDVAQTNGDGGCGRGNSAPNCQVAAALGFSDCVQGAGNSTLTTQQLAQAVAFVSHLDGIPIPADTSASLFGGAAASAPSSTASSDMASSSAVAATSNSNSTTVASSAPASTTFSPSSFVSTGLGPGVVTDACESDTDCQQGCCAFSTGKCAGPDVAQTNGDGGCGRGNPAPNCQVAAALGLSGCVAGGSVAAGTLTIEQLAKAVEFVSHLDGLPIPANVSAAFAAAGTGAVPPAMSTPRRLVRWAPRV